jgi:multiple sugar transport system permease protein
MRSQSATALRLLVILVFLLPVGWMVLGALRPPGEPLGAVWPSRLSLGNVARLLSVVPLLRFTANSLLVAALTVPAAVLVASWAGFAMALLPRPEQRFWVLLSLVVLMVPGAALWTSRFLLYRWLGIIDTVWALVAPALLGLSPFFVLMYYRAFRRVPAAVYDAARLDGAGVLATWSQVAMPVVRATSGAVAVLAFIAVWGDTIGPALYLSDTTRTTLPVGLRLLEQLGRSDYPLLMTGACWAAALPVALLAALVVLYRRASRRRSPIMSTGDRA